ncbi:tyrosine-type recombinase/integrase [Anaerosporobacter sp.]
MKYNVYQRSSDSRFVASSDVGADAFGKRKRIVAYGKTEREATKKLREKLFEYENSDIKDTKETLVAFLSEYIKRNKDNWADTTVSLYEMYVTKHIEPYFKTQKVKDLTPIMVDDFYSYKIESGSSSNTVLKYHRFLNSAFNYGVKKDIITKNVCEKATAPKHIDYSPNIYEQDQFNQLWNYVKDKYDRVPIILGAACGFRRGEIFGLKWTDIDFKNCKIKIQETCVRFDKTIIKDPKNQFSKREISVPKYVIDVLKDYMKEQKVINLNSNIMTVDPSYYSHRFKWILNKYNLPPTRLHDLRHYNATLMMNLGIPDKIASERLGHKDTTMLKKIYQHNQKSVDKATSEKINEVFSNSL